MNGRTTKLLRKSSPNKAGYKLVKKAWPHLPQPMRHQGKLMMMDLIEVERQHNELSKMNMQPPVGMGELPSIDPMPMPGPQ